MYLSIYLSSYQSIYPYLHHPACASWGCRWRRPGGSRGSRWWSRSGAVGYPATKTTWWFILVHFSVSLSAACWSLYPSIPDIYYYLFCKICNNCFELRSILSHNLCPSIIQRCIYRVVIKYCAFLDLSLCTQTDTERGEPREARVQNIFKNLWKQTILS